MSGPIQDAASAIATALDLLAEAMYSDRTLRRNATMVSEAAEVVRLLARLLAEAVVVTNARDAEIATLRALLGEARADVSVSHDAYLEWEDHAAVAEIADLLARIDATLAAKEPA